MTAKEETTHEPGDLTAFKRYSTERVLLAYDRDDAGEKAAESLAEKLIAQGIECFRLHFPKGMDANEYALTVKPRGEISGCAHPQRAVAWWCWERGRPARRREAQLTQTLFALTRSLRASRPRSQQEKRPHHRKRLRSRNRSRFSP